MKDLILLSLFCTLSHQLVKAGDSYMEFLKKIGVPSHYIKGEDNSYSHKNNQFPGAGDRFREDKMNNYRFPGAWTRIREDQMNNYHFPRSDDRFWDDKMRNNKFSRNNDRFLGGEMNHRSPLKIHDEFLAEESKNIETPSIGKGFLEDELKALQCIRSFVKLAIEKYSLIRQFLEQFKHGIMEAEKKES